jgi:hypothetical protein
MTEDAREWMAENIPAEKCFGTAIFVQPNSVPSIIGRIEQSGRRCKLEFETFLVIEIAKTW